MLKINDLEMSKNISSVLRAGRKLRGFSQREIAEVLGVNQATLSRYETGILMPSITDWYNFCVKIGIDAHKSYMFGFIDNNTKFTPKLYNSNTFRLPQKMLSDNQLKVREILPLFDLVHLSFTENEVSSFMKNNKIDSDIFKVYDLQVSYSLFILLYQFLKNKNSTAEISQALIHQSSHLNLHGNLNEEYKNIGNSIQLLKKIIGNNSLYNNVLKLTQDKTSSKLKYLVKIKDDKFNSLDEEFQRFFIDYKFKSIKMLTLLNSDSLNGIKIINKKTKSCWNLGIEMVIS